MRRPTLPETCLLVLFWIFVLRKIVRSFEMTSFDTGILVWGILALMWTYRYLNAKAYANMKKNQAAHETYMAQRFGRWRLLVEWSPILFLLAMFLLAWLIRPKGLPLLIIGLIGLFALSVWVGTQGNGSSSEDP